MRRAWLAAAAFIVYGTLIPFRFVDSTAAVRANLARVSLNPLMAPDTRRRVSIPDVVQNILLFLPFGAAGVLAGARRASTGATRVAAVTIAGVALSAAVEGLQLFTTNRVTSLSDVCANGIGALCGAVGASIGRRLGMRGLAAARLAGWTSGEAFYTAVIATAVVCVGVWEPFDVTLDVSTAAAKIHALAHDVWQFGVLTDEGLSVLWHALWAAALCRWLSSINGRSPAVVAAGVAAPASVLLEASQALITSRMPGLEDALVAVCGVLLGVAAWMALRRRSAAWLAFYAVLIGTVVGTALQQLSPFTVAKTFHPVQWLPFMGYYVHTTFETVSHVIELAIDYFPLGFVLAGFARPRRAAFWSALLSLAVAMPIEYLQGWIVGRYPDATDVALCGIGGWLGAWAATSGRAAFDRAAEGVSPKTAGQEQLVGLR